MSRITIKALHEPYRRAGVSHSTQPVTHEAGAFTAEQIRLLERDPHLVVVIEDGGAKAKGAGGGAGGDSASVSNPVTGKTGESGGAPAGGGTEGGGAPAGDGGSSDSGKAPAKTTTKAPAKAPAKAGKAAGGKAK